MHVRSPPSLGHYYAHKLLLHHQTNSSRVWLHRKSCMQNFAQDKTQTWYFFARKREADAISLFGQHQVENDTRKSYVKRNTSRKKTLWCKPNQPAINSQKFQLLDDWWLNTCSSFYCWGLCLLRFAWEWELPNNMQILRKELNLKTQKHHTSQKKESTTGARGHITRCTATTAAYCWHSLVMFSWNFRARCKGLCNQNVDTGSFVSFFFLLVSPIHFPRPLSLLHWTNVLACCILSCCWIFFNWVMLSLLLGRLRC